MSPLLRRATTQLSLLLLPALGLGLWELVVRVWTIPPYVLPAPSAVFKLMAHAYPALAQHTLVTLSEILLGLGLALGVSFPLAVAIFYSKALERLLYPWLIASQAVPVFAIAPLLVLWFGLGIGSKVAVTALIAFFPLVVNAVDGLRSVDPDFVKLFHTLRASEWAIFWKLRVPAALPFLLSGLKIGVVVSTIGAVFGEWVSSTAGLGYWMFLANAQLNLEKLFAAILWLATLGLGLFSLISLLERLLLRWRWIA
jgi:ABC-type nitrate/sulfonate/bicarbonate transport system permease component